MKKTYQRLPESELDIMLVLWNNTPPMTRPEIEKVINTKKKLASTTILSLLAVDVVREFTKLKLELMPYVYQLGLQPHANGTPVMRSMFVEFPDDPACRTLDRQYMFGPSMLVAPVFTYSGEVSYRFRCGCATAA